MFLSSHILSEIEHTCDRAAILNRARCVVHGTVRRAASTGASQAMLVKAADLDLALVALRRDGLTAERQADHVRGRDRPDRGIAVTRVLAREHQWVTDLRPEERSLEDLFLELTGNVELHDVHEEVCA